MTTCDDHIQLRISVSESSSSRRDLITTQGFRIIPYENCQFVNVRGDPSNAMEQFVSDNANAICVDERSTRSRTKHRIEHNPLPRDFAGLRPQKGGDFVRHSGAAQHPDLDAG